MRVVSRANSVFTSIIVTLYNGAGNKVDTGWERGDCETRAKITALARWVDDIITSTLSFINDSSASDAAYDTP